MEDATVAALFGGMGGLYVLAVSGLYLVLTRIGKLEGHMTHTRSCNIRIRMALRLLIRRSKAQDEMLRKHTAQEA